MRRKRERLSLRCGLPEDALGDRPRVTWTGTTSVLIEGQHGVVELAAQCIRLKTGAGILGVSGKALRLEELSLDAAMICGERIDAIAYGAALRGTGKQGGNP